MLFYSRSQVQLGNQKKSSGDIPFAKLELGAHMRPQAGAWGREGKISPPSDSLPLSTIP
jgi:hypothetical protein